jgi:hypothetical protein
MSKHTTDGQDEGLVPHHPSTWPDSTKCDSEFIESLKRIIKESILAEIDNVIEDAQQRRGNLDKRGYVVAVALMCALDAISSYGYGNRRGAQIPDFIRAHFPKAYYEHANLILRAYRDFSVHSWHLFAAGITAEGEAISFCKGVPCINLLHLRDALASGVEFYFEDLKTNETLRGMTLKRYRGLRRKAKRAW